MEQRGSYRDRWPEKKGRRPTDRYYNNYNSSQSQGPQEHHMRATYLPKSGRASAKKWLLSAHLRKDRLEVGA